ncbi:MAG: hypothetical protein GY729_22420 [Desulfobacteraceae bacterium]|nr:hypothetical protein [Desulfobacteraceae bacterium]
MTIYRVFVQALKKEYGPVPAGIGADHRVHENIFDPIVRHTKLIVIMTVSSEDTWERVAPSLMILRRALKKCVKGNTIDCHCTII